MHLRDSETKDNSTLVTHGSTGGSSGERNRSISESEVDQARVSSTRVDVDLTPWLKHGDNAHTLQVCYN